MLALRPFKTAASLAAAARREWFGLTPEDWREAMLVWRMSTSSYSRRPTCAIVNPPALTKRREGNVGSPVSVGPPSAVSPRSTTVKAHSAWLVAAG